MFFTIITVNFTSYTAYFDINAFMIIDLTSITKHVLGIVILFTLVSSSIMICFLVINNFILLPIYQMKLFNKEYNKPFDNFFTSFYLRLISVILVFSFIYMGIYNTLYLISFFILFFILIYLYSILKSIIFRIRNVQDNKATFVEVLMNIKSDDYLPLIKKFLYDNLTSSLALVLYSKKASKIALNKDNFIKFITTNIGIMIVFLSLFMGIARADYIENNMEVSINKEKDFYTLFLNTSNGVLLYSERKDNVRFISWDRLDDLSFKKEKKRNWTNLF